MKNTFYKEAETKVKLCEFIMASNKLSMGDEVSRFELSFAKWQGCNYAVMVNSGSSANLILLQSLVNLKRIRSGARIGVSAVTWATNVMPIIQMGCIPVLIDVNLQLLNITLESVRKHRIDCLFITHLLGFHGDIVNIAEYCQNNNIILLEDTCESLGTVVSDRKLGNFGLASTFSTFVGHHMSTIEGGLVCTNDSELNMMLRMVRSHGWDRNVSPEQRESLRTAWNIDDFHGPYTFYNLAYNVRPTEISGFIGSVQLEYVDCANKARRNIFSIIKPKINSKTSIYTVDIDVPAFAIPIVCKNVETKNYCAQLFKDAGIETRPIVSGNMSRQPFMIEYAEHMPNADKIHENGLYIPNHADLSNQDIERILSVISQIE